MLELAREQVRPSMTICISAGVDICVVATRSRLLQALIDNGTIQTLAQCVTEEVMVQGNTKSMFLVSVTITKSSDN